MSLPISYPSTTGTEIDVYDRSVMFRCSESSYHLRHMALPEPPRQYSPTDSTRSSVSAVANSSHERSRRFNLAESRRIQNRIAQRRYRQKLKKRVDGFRSPVSSSLEGPSKKSIEPMRLDATASIRTPSILIPCPRLESNDLGWDDNFGKPDRQYVFPSSEYRSTFVQQHTEQGSTSSLPNIDASYSPSCEQCQFLLTKYGLLHRFDIQSMHQAHARHQSMPPAEDMTSPFSVSYACIADRDVSTNKGNH